MVSAAAECVARLANDETPTHSWALTSWLLSYLCRLGLMGRGLGFRIQVRSRQMHLRGRGAEAR